MREGESVTAHSDGLKAETERRMFSTLSLSHFSHMPLIHARDDNALRIKSVQHKAIVPLFITLMHELLYKGGENYSNAPFTIFFFSLN